MKNHDAARRPPWTGAYKHNWDESYKRVMAWWHCEETDRPVVFGGAPKPASEIRGTYIGAKTAEEAERFGLDPDVQLTNNRCNVENNLYLAESAPGTMVYYGSTIALPCVQAGGKIRYAPDLHAWIERDETIYERPLPELSQPCRELDFILDMIRRYHETFGFDVVLGAYPMLDPLTTLSMLRGSENFLMDLIDRPAEVKRWAARLGEFHRQAVESFRAARAVYGRREDFNWTGAWAPGDMDAVQCDVSAMLSPEMFREFVLPEAEREAAFYDYTIWHLDGTDEFKHIDDICAIPNLHAIQYVDEKSRDPIEFAHIWEHILRKGKSIVFSCDARYAPALTKRLGRKGLAFASWCDTEAGMERLLKQLE